MSELKPTILKIGGSTITDKGKKFSVRIQTINRLAAEIRDANVKNLIIVHGGGSFGHPIAQAYSIKDGLKNEAQRIGFSETHYAMSILNGLFMDALVSRNLPAVSIAPSSCVITRNGEVQRFEDRPLRMLLKMGFLPVLYGDTVLDTELGFTILSGDRLVSLLAVKYNAERIVIGVDVDGLYDADPKTEGSARMFSHLTLNELRGLKDKLEKPSTCDVTGGMPQKIAELIPAIERGIPVMIVNATKSGYVYRALKEKKVKGTLIEK